MLPQTPEQWGMVLFTVGVIGGMFIGLWTRWDYKADQAIRASYKGAGVAYDDTELAQQIDDEQAWREWAAICGVLGINPDAGTPIYDRLVCDEIERANGWAS